MGQKWKIALKVSVVLSLGLLVLILAGSTWDYSGSSQFCVSCHTMESVTSSHSTSAHAEVSCTNCHLGVGFSPAMLFKKATEVNQVVKNVTGTYDKPIRIRNHVPVKKSCESCHYTKGFNTARLKITQTFDDDEANTRLNSALLLNVGDGTKAQGIHWHVENKILYGKDAEGSIVYVEAEKTDGQKGLYLSKDAPEPASFKEMDCVDCHNRIAHEIDTPEKLTDEYLLENRLDPSLPYLKREVTGALEAAKDISPEEWPENFAGITTFYRQNYPQVYNERKADIERLPSILTEMAGQILFPGMKVSWETYKDNLGHEGCFQCHNPSLQLVPEKSDGDWPETIRVDCQLCHSSPVTARGEEKSINIDFN